jgi:hypothetical protein
MKFIFVIESLLENNVSSLVEPCAFVRLSFFWCVAVLASIIHSLGWECDKNNFI